MKAIPSMYNAFDKVAATVRSCKTEIHIESSENMIANFSNLYGFTETSFQIQYLKSLLTNKWTDILYEK
jgi:hypothetical protein